MKKLIVIIGPNGVGKSTTASALLEKCPQCAYVDSDWCRRINPFAFTEATKQTVIENIYCLIKNYLLCSDIRTVVFPYGFHGERKEIFDLVMQKLKSDEIEISLKLIVLKCSLDENRKRAMADGRDLERIERGINNTFHFYDGYTCPSIDTTMLTPEKVAERILEIADC